MNAREIKQLYQTFLRVEKKWFNSKNSKENIENIYF